MRHLFILTLFLLAMLSNCKKEQIIIKTPQPIDTVTVPQHIIDFGKSTVLKNGTAWNVAFNAYYEYQTKARFNILAEKEYPDGLIETAGIGDIPLAVGRYTVKMIAKFSDFNNSVPDGYYGMAIYEEGVGNFYPDTTRTDNYIEVLRCDTIANEVEGRFQVFMGKRGGPSTLPGVPDSVFLTQGQFYLPLK